MWRKLVGVEPTPPAGGGKRPVLKTGRATGPRELPVNDCSHPEPMETVFRQVIRRAV
jgi:hypothetical protein